MPSIGTSQQKPYLLNCHLILQIYEKIIFLTTFLLFHCFSFGQITSHSCSMTAVGSSNANEHASFNGLISSTGLDFFSGNEGCSTTTLNVNYIFLYKDDGTGNFNFSNPDESAYINSIL